MKNTDKKSFAFQLASKQKADNSKQWKIRDGIAVAGCTGPNERYSTFRSYDGGVYC